MTPTIFKVADIGKGAIYVMPKPSSEQLEQDILFFKDIGITQVISLLKPEEADDIGLALEQKYCQQHGLTFTSYPIEDRGIPELDNLPSLTKPLYQEILAGANVAIHCKGGDGRTGVLSCSLLVESGLTAQQAMASVTIARGKSVPDTNEQKTFVADYEVKFKQKQSKY